MNDHDRDIGALKREWLAARIVLIGGFAIAIAASIYAGTLWRGEIIRARQKASATFSQEQAASAQEQANAKAAAQFCTAALANAKTLGIVPKFGALTEVDPQRTKMTGRYLCLAATESSKFTIAADLVCRDLKKAQCVSLYSVVQNGKTVLYHRDD